MKTVLFLLLLCPFVSRAQTIKITPEDTERKHSYLLMRDGTVLKGQIIRQDSTIITLRKQNGDMSFIETDLIRSIAARNPGQQADPNQLANGSTVFVLKDGVRLPGTFVRRNETMITVRKQNGQLTYFEPELLVRVDTVRAEGIDTGFPNSGKRAFPNRFSPYMVYNPTAYNPDKGRFYYRNVWLVLNELHYGITRHWSIGAIINPFYSDYSKNAARELVFGFNYRFATRLTFPIGDQFRFGVDANYQPPQAGPLIGRVQILTLRGMASLGTSQRNATLAYGRTYVNYSPSYAQAYSFISASVMHKLGRTLTLISDNTFYLNPYLTGSSANLSLALRLDRRQHAFDIGAVSVIIPKYYYLAVPYISASPVYPIVSSSPNTTAYFFPYIAYNLRIGRE